MRGLHHGQKPQNVKSKGQTPRASVAPSAFVKLGGSLNSGEHLQHKNLSPFDQRSFSNEPVREKLIRYRDYFAEKSQEREA